MFNSLASAAGLSRPKKKFHFDVSFTLDNLLNCTYVAGLIFSKIRLIDGGNYNTYKFTAQSNSCDVRDHTVNWGEQFDFHCKIYGSPVTGELEPCCCKVSIRKELRGGRSYKKLGYVRINLAEYAGAGAMQRKYLLESYNEHKHKPDNSILTVTIALRQTSGDSVFRAPRAVDSMWGELGEAPEDEGIQPDLHSLPPRHSYNSSRVSATSSALSFYSSTVPVSPNSSTETGDPSVTGTGERSVTGTGGPPGPDLETVNGTAKDGKKETVCVEKGCGTGGKETDKDSRVKEGGGGGGGGGGKGGRGGLKVAGVRSAGSAGSGGGSLQDIRSSLNREPRKTSSACNLRGASINDLHDLSVVEEGVTEALSGDHSSLSLSPLGPLPALPDKLKARAGSLENTSPPDTDIHSHTIGGTRFPLPPLGGPTHRRLSSWSQASNGRSPSGMHRRQQSLVSNQSSKSTSAYSTLSERSTAGSVIEGGDGDYMSSSLRARHGTLSSRVEQSRVDPQAVVDSLFSSHTFSHSEAQLNGDQGGLKLYVDKSLGTVTLAGTNLDQRNLQAVDVEKHRTQSPRRRRSRKESRQGKERAARDTSPRELSPPPSFSLAPAHNDASSTPIAAKEVNKAEVNKGKLEPPTSRDRANSASSSSDSTKTLTPSTPSR